MRGLLLLCIGFLVFGTLFGQKPMIDTSVFGKWPFVYAEKISGDGRYVTYTIREPEGERQVFSANYSSWKKVFPRSAGADLLSNNRYAVFRTADDSLFLLRLGTEERRYIGRAAFRGLFRDHDMHEWMAYQELTGDKRFVIRETSTGKVQTESDVKTSLFNAASGVLLLLVQKEPGSSGEQSLYRWNLVTGEKRCIWRGVRSGKYIFDEDGKQNAFITDEQPGRTIWYYKKGMERAEKWVSDSAAGIDSNLRITTEPFINNGPIVFSRDGKSLFFQLMEQPGPQADASAVKVDVWNYKDTYLQEEQSARFLAPRKYTAVVSTQEKRVYRLLQQDEDFYVSVDLRYCNQYVMVTKHGGNADVWWQPNSRSCVYLESVRDNSRMLLKDNIPYTHEVYESLNFCLSPGEKYVVYYDPVENNYFSYDIVSGVTRNLTNGINVRWRDHNNPCTDPVAGAAEGIAGWLEKDKAVLIYDAFDIWQLDPSGIQPPLNITNGYGFSKHTRFRLIGDPGRQSLLAPNARLLLSAFDTVSKYSGFYSKYLQQSGNPSKLTMGPYKYSVPVRSSNADVWVVLRQSAVDAPNFYVTKDWKAFTVISEICPQLGYNWLTSELVTWALPDGRHEQGILYKPEDFDERKKYPLLIHYYEEHSEELYEFKNPEAIRDDINVPYFTSRGYLVFVPDIHYKPGSPGESVLNTVMSGVRYLCQYPWIDSMRMGLQGHSFGGWETNFLITHTHIFAAAAEGSGYADLISDYGALNAMGRTSQYYYEMSQGRIGSSFWQRPDLYINASPIFKADQVTTPLLMMHNKGDKIVPWTQGIEFFTALRRLGKKVWMLQYDRGAHFVEDRDAIDYTIRMTQFFDHFLKGHAAPRWMTEGILARRKGLDKGYELDNDERIP